MGCSIGLAREAFFPVTGMECITAHIIYAFDKVPERPGVVFL